MATKRGLQNSLEEKIDQILVVSLSLGWDWQPRGMSQDFLGRKLRIEHLQVVIVVAFVVLLLQKFYQFFAPVRTSYRTVLGKSSPALSFPTLHRALILRLTPFSVLTVHKMSISLQHQLEVTNNNIKNRCQLILIYVYSVNAYVKHLIPKGWKSELVR
jgi:hypothetical protein